jgi:hypothetical protein
MGRFAHTRQKGCVGMEQIRQVLFLSVDIAGSTAYKHGQKIHQWKNAFSDFYEHFPLAFENSWQESQRGSQILKDKYAPSPWKSIGDELVFCSYPQSSFEVVEQVRSFIRTINAYGKAKLEAINGSHKLGLKATAWLAEIPTVNLKILKPQRIEHQDSTYENRSTQSESFANVDFIGPSIDAGFRLAKFATTEKCIVSVELAAILAAKLNEKIYFDGLQPMKGVLDETPYPIIWLPLTLAHSTENLRSSISPASKLSAFCRDFITKEIEEKFEINTYPYFENDDTFGILNSKHKDAYEEFMRTLEQSEGYESEATSTEILSGETDESSAKTNILLEELSRMT